MDAAEGWSGSRVELFARIRRDARVEGLSVRACGLPEKETGCVYAGLTTDSARVEAGELLESENPPTGCVTATVPTAMGVMAALADKKLDIPREVSLVAREDVRLAEQLKPTLTTAGTDIDAQGQTMSLALIDAIEGNPLPSEAWRHALQSGRAQDSSPRLPPPQIPNPMPSRCRPCMPVRISSIGTDRMSCPAIVARKRGAPWHRTGTGMRT
jgi:hypothetical protein